MINKKKRPVFLNLVQIRLPIAGVMSIAHRIAGVLLFLSLPFALYLLDLSLASPEGFEQVLSLLRSVWLLPFYFVISWALVHHFLAGIRYLLLDVDIAIDKPAYRVTAMTVLVAAPAIVMLFLLLVMQ
jgi:succinate dehydrogenase / fumarate reductase cytochrome b subunit